MFDHQQAAVVVKLGQRFAVDALGFFGIPLDKTCALGDFAFGLGKRFALFGRHDASEVFLVRHQQIEPFAQNSAAFFTCFGFPWAPGGVGGGNRSFGLGGTEIGYISEFFAGRRVIDIKTAGTCHPLPVDQRIGF